MLISTDTHRAEVQTFLSECPTALLVLLAAAARAGLVRLGLLRFRLAQRLGRVIAHDRLYAPNVLERVVNSSFRRQGVEPQGLLVVLGDAAAMLVTLRKVVSGSRTSDTASPASITALNAHRPTQYDASIILPTSSLRPPGLI